MSGTDAGVVDTVLPAPCDFCSGFPAVVYCRADAASLCLLCDRHVHGVNAVASRHVRAPLCAACREVAAAFRRAAEVRFLCSNCDFERQRDGPRGEPLADRCSVEAYTGCPSVAELAAILGVGECETAGGQGWWSVWEENWVFSLDELIVPTTSCHCLQPLLPSLPKNQSSPSVKLNEDVLRQLSELANSETAMQAPAAAQEEAEPVCDQLPSWATLQYTIGHGGFDTEATHEATSTAVPSYEIAQKKLQVGSSSEACLSSFTAISEICPSISHSSSIDTGHQDHAMAMQALPKKGGYDMAYPDRDKVISRYKEKRKSRRFDKKIRYESRKVRADGRLRIKGRFAKASQN